MKSVPIFLSLAIFALVLTGCSGSSSTPSTSAAGHKTTEQSKVDSLRIDDVKVGDGGDFGIMDGAKPGDKLAVIYSGSLPDGKIFDSNTDSTKPVFTFTLGAGAVIKGWDQGLVGMKVGGERKLSIPSALAYGNKTMGAAIPANSDLFFDVKLLDLSHKDGEFDVTPDDLKVGTGPEVAKGDTVTIHYTVTDLRGSELDSNNDEGYTWVVGSGKTYPGVELGMTGMKKGGIRKIRLGTGLAMRASSKMAMMQQAGVQILKVELMSIKPGGKTSP